MLCPYALLDLHLLDSRLREEDYMLIKVKVRVDQHTRPSEDMSKSASLILVYGGAICESSPCEAQVDY